MKLNPNRWQQDVGFVETAEILLVNGPNARQTAVLTGALHAANRVDLKTVHMTVHMLKRKSGVRILDVPGRMHHVFPMNTEVAPFDNNDLRLALPFAIDREEYLEKILKGYGTLGNDNPIGAATASSAGG